jgi:hypothetical membrane protein
MNCFRGMLAGTLLFTGIAIFIIGLNIAEQLYPDYSASLNYVSDLGATCHSTNCETIQPSAMIFNSSIFLAGIFVAVAAYLIHSEFNSRVFSFSLALSGIGTMCVGIFPESAGHIHALAALIAFTFGGLSAITAFAFLRPLFSYVSVLFGVMALIALALLILHIDMGLGPGGIERLVIYPILIWAIGFGGYLMHYFQEIPKNKRD